MSSKVQWGVFVALLLVAVWVWTGTMRDSGVVGALLGPERVDRFVVPNPTLRLDLLQAISALDYPGMKRNIFNAAPLPPPVVAQKPAPPPEDVGPKPPEQPPPDPPLVLPFKFYGYVVDSRSGHRRGFFTNGDDIWVAAEGELFGRRFKLLRLSNTRAEVEEVASGKRATLQLDETAAPSGGL